MIIDLHMHSTCSDGTFTPTELVREAKASGLTHMALTDHDTVGGVAEAREEALRQGIAFLSGLEISAECQPGTLHILGYGVDETSPPLLERLTAVQRWRDERNPKIVEKLGQLGVALTLPEVEAASGGGLVGRPHFAKVLVDKGYVATRQEAFDRYLAKGRPAYVDKARLSPEESIALIRAAGGVAVLAHPLQLQTPDEATLDAILRALVEAGLQGLECHYRNHTPEDTRRFLALAKRYGLLVTGGSDFHGTNRPGIRLGVGEGELKVPGECWESLTNALRRSALQSATGGEAPAHRPQERPPTREAEARRSALQSAISKDNRRPHQSALRRGRYSKAGLWYALTKCVAGRAALLVQRGPFSSPSPASIVVEGLLELERQGVWNCAAYVIMPDHFHAVVELREGSLPRAMNSLGKFTARRINSMLHRHGALWQPGYYDHCLRGDKALVAYLDYMMNNPVRAGLVERSQEWPFAAIRWDAE